MQTDQLINLILEQNLADQKQIDQWQLQAKQFNQTLFQYITQHRCIQSEILANASSKQFQRQLITLSSNYTINTDDFFIFKHWIENYLLLPIEKNKCVMIIAIANVNDFEIEEQCRFQTGIHVQFVITHYDKLINIHNFIFIKNTYLKMQNTSVFSAQIIAHHILSDAIHRYASDIHIELYQNSCRLRMRIDGLLHHITNIPLSITQAICSCIKVQAKLDIAVKRLPQDGRMIAQSYLGFVRDCRISTYPTLYGEKLVIRLLNSNVKLLQINELGLSINNQQNIIDIINRPQGLILITGPTGSGKTVTLYTLLNQLNQLHRNISTIEDPIEIHIEGINQSQINPKLQFTFSEALRALLRQDPDIIMIGEIRDKETAQMAIRAAQTGHLVLSTLHTNNASETINRLLTMGIAPFQLANALSLIISQRLVRKLCSNCKKLSGLQNTPNKHVFEPNGCTQCTEGYHGRIGIFELLKMNYQIKQSLLQKNFCTLMQNYEQETLWQSALLAVKNGVTSLSEIYRIIPTDDKHDTLSI